MKFLETHFEEYIRSVDKVNLHPSLKKNSDIYFPNDIQKLRHLIFYGPSGVGKYSQALYHIKKYSPTDLKYERKMNMSIGKGKGKNYNIKISDMHFEIDMNLLGCNAKALWNELFYHILDIISTRPQHTGIIICKNFHKIHSELLDVFYSYMQTLIHKNIHLVYILLTEQVSFIPLDILNRTTIISLPRPSKTMYRRCTGKQVTYKTAEIENIKDIHIGVTQLMKPYNIISNRIIRQIDDYKNLNFLEFRETLYDLFIYNIDIVECIWYIMIHYIDKGKLTKDNICQIFIKLHIFLKYFNNNYRPIYHIENFMIYLCKTIHGF
jgi:hypothetical protein